MKKHKGKEGIIGKLSEFRRGLRGDEGDKFDDMMYKARKHKTAGDEEDCPKVSSNFTIHLTKQPSIARDIC